MDNKQLFEVTISYPEQPGFILQAYHLQRKLTSLFGVLSVRLEDSQDGRCTVVSNGSTLYESLPENSIEIDMQKIITAVSTYKKPLVDEQVFKTEPDDSNDPEYQQWMNCVCSGE